MKNIPTLILGLLLAGSIVTEAGTLHTPTKFNTIGLQHSLSQNIADHTVPGAFIIQYKESFNHEALRSTLATQSVDYSVRHEYSHFHGASIQLLTSEVVNLQGIDNPLDFFQVTAQMLANLDGVENVWPVSIYKLMDPVKIQVVQSGQVHVTLEAAHNMTGVTFVHDNLGYTGEGVKVGIIDSGVDYTHPALGGCFGANCRVFTGWDFVGDGYTGTNPRPDGDPQDCNAHGTHVAGIVGADASHITKPPYPPAPFVGVAPKVRFGAYRVFGCAGSGSNDVILKAMEMAYEQGMNIINMSLGGGPAYKTDPTSVLADKLVKQGMSVIGAAGNDGSQGISTVSSTGLGDLSTSVASFDNIGGMFDFFTFGGVQYPYKSAMQYGKDRINLPGSTTIVPLSSADGKTLLDGCQDSDYQGHNVTGKIVLASGDITRCKSGVRAQGAKSAGAAGMLTQSNYGMDNLAGIKGFPMAALDHASGNAIWEQVKKDPNTVVEWGAADAKKKMFPIEGGGSPSDFSSWGLDGELRIKPDLAAPGGNILSTYPVRNGSYAVLSGTSMATPYVAGSYALLFQALKKPIHGDVARQIFMNTAVPGHGAQQSALTSVAKQGAGLINVQNALTATGSLSPDRIQLLDSIKFTGTAFNITLHNLDQHNAVTYDLSVQYSQSVISYPNSSVTFPLDTPQVGTDQASVQFPESKLTIPANGVHNFTVHFKEPASGDSAHWPMYGGWIVATPQSTANTADNHSIPAVPLRVPFAGVKGDLSKMPMMDTAFGAPDIVLVDENGRITTGGPQGMVNFKTVFPAVLTRLGSHSPRLTIALLDTTGKEVGVWDTEGYGRADIPVGRDLDVDPEGTKAFTAWIWSKGKVFETPNAVAAKEVPRGTYSVRVSCQKKFTEGVFPRDFEVYSLGNLTIG